VRLVEALAVRYGTNPIEVRRWDAPTIYHHMTLLDWADGGGSGSGQAVGAPAGGGYKAPQVDPMLTELGSLSVPIG